VHLAEFRGVAPTREQLATYALRFIFNIKVTVLSTLYKQVKLQHSAGEQEIAWIPEQYAKRSKCLIIGSSKRFGSAAVVLEVLSNKSYSQHYLELNRKHPLRKVTDI